MTTGERWRPRSGANVTSAGVDFAVWAPNARRVEVELIDRDGQSTYVSLRAHSDGRFTNIIAGAGPGTRYRYRLDGDAAYPDPYSRYQPEGVHGPSQVIDPEAFVWTDDDWPGVSADNQVIYELHVGAMTPEGTFAALIDQLPELKRLGVTMIELMPVAECPGRWNWGYDGVDLFAPSHNYGEPDDLRALVDAAHALGLGVMLDVVYNHLGPDGNYLAAFAKQYFTDRHKTPWGDGLNWEGPDSAWVRAFAVDNACYWIDEFHIDGLRLDATDHLLDDSPMHICAELTAAARQVAGERHIVVIAEDARNDVSRIRPRAAGGEGLDGVWADDFHHEIRVLLTNVHRAYYADYAGTTSDIATTINDGFFYQGQTSPSTGKPRGTEVTDEPARSFVFCIQNHDQIGNRPMGGRLSHTINADRYTTASALLLFAPETPLLFMGQEFAASTPFYFFTDHNPTLGKLVTRGRRDEFHAFPDFHDAELARSIPDPQKPSPFSASKLRLDERVTHAPVYLLYEDLLALRTGDPVLRVNDRTHAHATGLTARIVMVHRWWGAEHRVLLANFGQRLTLDVAVHDELAQLPGLGWRLMVTTSDSRYGGSGELPLILHATSGRQLALPPRCATIWSFTG
jgi:maltooligosyltrehalose trehalohydrolase